MTGSLILLDSEGHTATITLNRPDKLNALTPDMLHDLESVIEQVDQDHRVRVAILTGAGERAFCVGADINAWAALDPLDMWRRWIRDGHRVFDRLVNLRVPTIAVLNGYTFGGGLELALACDMRLAAVDIQLALPEVTIGTIPGWGGTERLPRLIGAGRARQMIFTGGRIDAHTAESWGLVNTLHPRDELLNQAREMAQIIAHNAPLAVQMAKHVINSGGGVALEALAGSLAAHTADGREGVASFREKRAPNYTGN